MIIPPPCFSKTVQEHLRFWSFAGEHVFYRLSVKFKVCFALPYVFTPVTKLRCPPQNRDWLPSKEDEQVPTARHESPR